MIQFRIRLWNKAQDFVSEAMLGEHSLRREIDHLPIGWRLEVERVSWPDGSRDESTTDEGPYEVRVVQE